MSAEPSTRQRMTEEEFLNSGLVDELPSWEFVNGEVFQKRTMTKRSHVDLIKLLIKLLMRYEDETGGYYGGEATVNTSRDADRRYRVPDLAFWAPGRDIGDAIFTVPTLAIEVRSPGQTLTYLRGKCEEYRDRGVEACWLIIPETRTVEIWDESHAGEAVSGDAVLETRSLPGLRVELSVLFSVLDRSG